MSTTQQTSSKALAGARHSEFPGTLARTQLACCVLGASAFVLAALLLATLAGRFAPLTQNAHASMVQTADDYVLMTAVTRNDDESLFVLDNRMRKLIVYRTDVNRNRTTPIIIQDLDDIFRQVPARR